MKKNLFYYLFAVICLVTLFTACSDDDEDTTWQQIPEITNDNVTLKLNDKTPAGATATLDIIDGENAKVTLVNVIYGHESVPVDVTMEKNNDTSYTFSGSTDLDAAKEAMTSSPLKVAVSGIVDTAGKVTIDVVTSGWASVSGVYANDSLAITFDGKSHSNDADYAVTLTVKDNGSAATLVFKKIVNVGLNVEANVALDKGKISGTVEPKLGYTVTIDGSVDNTGKLTLDLVSSGYGTIAGSYSARSNSINFNGKVLTNGSVSVKVLSETKAQVSLSGILVGDRNAVIEGVVITKEEDKEVYAINGELKNDNYAITFKGAVGENRKLTADVTYKVIGDIVGKWNLMKASETMAAPIFKFATNKGSVTLPESLLAIIPEDMKPMFPATMPDAQLIEVVQGLLGNYAIYLQSIEFTEKGRVIATYVDMPKDINGDGKIDAMDQVDTTPKTFDMLQYYMEDGELYLAVDLNELLSMMSADKARAWDPSTILSKGIPVGYQISDNILSVSLVTDVVVGLAGFVNSMLPIIGMMLPEEMKPQFDVIEKIFSEIVAGIIPDVKELEVGLRFTK